MSEDKDSRPEQTESTKDSAPVPPALLGDPELIVEVVRDATARDDRDR
jgi:hypothetical protein